MASEPLQVYSGKQILLGYYNRVNRKNLTVYDVQFGLPSRVETVGTNFNTTIRMYPNIGTPYFGSPRLDYDRIHVSQLGVIVVPKGLAVRVHDLLPVINNKYNINLTEDDVENDLLAAGSGNVTIALRIKPESVLFYDGAVIYTPNYPDPATQPLPQVDYFAFWSAYRSSANVVLSDNDRAGLMNAEHMAQTQLPITEGKIYWEIKIDAGSLMIGVGRPDTPKSATNANVLGEDETNWVLNTATGKLHHNGAIFNYTDPIVAGSTIGVLFDYAAGILTFILGNSTLGTAFTNLPPMPEVYPIMSGALTSNSKGTANFGQVPMFYTVPTGYNTGLYALVPPGGTTPPPPGSGGGTGTNPPAGTVLGSFCQDGDFWMVTATGNGGFTMVLTQSESAQCGFDEDNFPIIDGGGPGDEEVPPDPPKPVLAAVTAPLAMDESAPANVQYTLSLPLATALELDFSVTWNTATSADITSFEFSSNGSNTWTPVATGESITIPIGHTSFAIRITPVADLTTEGVENFQITLREEVLNTKLENTTATSVQVVIGDTSKTPIVYPTAPTPPVDYEEQENYLFDVDHVSDFVINAPTGQPTLVWDNGIAEHVPSAMVFTTNNIGLSRFDLADEMTLDRRVSTSVKMKVRIDTNETASGSHLGLILHGTYETPDGYLNNGERIIMEGPLNAGSLAVFNVKWDDKNGRKGSTLIGTQAAAKLTTGTVHTVEYRFVRNDTGGFDATYHLDGVQSALVHIDNTYFTDTLKFRLGIAQSGSQAVKIFAIVISEKPYTPTLEPRMVRLQGVGSLNIPAGQTTIALTGRGGAGVNNPFRLDSVLTNEILKLHRGDPSLLVDNPAFVGIDVISKMGSTFIGYRYEIANSVAMTTNMDDWVLGAQDWRIKSSGILNGRMYFTLYGANNDSSMVPGKVYWTDNGLTATEMPLPANQQILINYVFEQFDDRLAISMRNTSTLATTVWITKDGETWIDMGFSGDIRKNGASWIAFLASSGMRNSSDGETWSIIPTRPVDFYDYSAVGGGQVLYTAGAIYYTTDNGATWNSRTFPGTNIQGLLYCNGLYVLKVRLTDGSNEDGIFYGPTVPSMVYQGDYVTESGRTTLFSQLTVIKNRFICPSTNTYNWLVSSTLTDWQVLSAANSQTNNNLSLVTEFDDRVLFPISSISSNGFSYMSVALEQEIAETSAGIIGLATTATIGSTTYSFPISSTPNLPGEQTSQNVPGVGNAVTLNYDAPVGTKLEVTFLDLPYNGVVAGTPIAEDCEGLDEVARFADGQGGEYLEILNKNTLECGYVADTEKTATLTGQGFITIPAGTTEITITGRGSSFTPVTLAQASAAIPVNLDIVILPGGYQAVDIAFGNGMYVVVGYIQDITNFLDKKIFYSTDMRNWSMASIVVSIYTEVVAFVINRFYVYASDAGNEVWTSNTGGDDWTYELITTQTSGYRRSKAITGNGRSIIWNQGYTLVRYAITTDGNSWTMTSNDSYHQCNGMLYNGSQFVSYGAGAADYYDGHYVRSSDDGVTWNTHAIPTFQGTGSTMIHQMVYLNGIYFGLVTAKINNYPAFSVIGTVRGSNLNNIVYDTAGAAGLERPYLITCGTYFVIVDINVIKYSQDANTWTTVPLASEFTSRLFRIGNVFTTGILGWEQPGFVVARSVAAGQQYVSKRAELGRPATVTVGNKIKLLPGNTYGSTPASNSTETFTVDAGDDTVVVYDCPASSAVTITYMSVADNNPTNGTVLGTSCDGFNEVTEYANGFGGSYFQVTTYNDPDCGYSPPILTTELTSASAVQVLEGATATIGFNLGQPLDVAVSFIVNVANTTATSDDYGNFYVIVNSVETAFTSGDEVEIPAGQLNFSIKFTAAIDTDDDIDEQFTITAVPTLNASRILSDDTVVTVTITNVVYKVQSQFITSDNMEDGTRMFSYAVRGAALVNRYGIIHTNEVSTPAKYYIPMPSVNLKTTIVGFGTTMTELFENDGNGDPVWTYPGKDNQSWGITEGGWYHMGTFNSVPGSTFNYTNAGILLNRIDGTMDLVLDGVAQNYNITGIPAGDLWMLFGTKDISEPQGFYVEFEDRDPTSYTPPAGYKRGWGELVEENSWNPPNPAPANDILTPAVLYSGQMRDGRGMVRFTDDNSLKSSVGVVDGVWQVEIAYSTTKAFRFGVGTSAFTTGTKVGATVDSWGMDSTMLNTYHNGVQTPIAEDSGVDASSFHVRMTVDRFNNRIVVRNGSREPILFSGQLPATGTELFLVFSTDEPSSSGGVRVYLNTGERDFDNQDYDANPGFGTYIGDPQYGTKISTFCDGTTLMGTYHNGDGTTYDESVKENSIACGYVPPAPEVVGWETGQFNDGLTVVEPGNDLTFNDVPSYTYAKSSVGHTTGKYYAELNNLTSYWYIAVALAGADPSNEGWGSSTSFFFSFTSGQAYGNDISDNTLEPDFYTKMDGKMVGLAIDLDARRVSIVYDDNSVNLLPDAEIPPGEVFFIMGCDYSINQTVSMNLGQVPFTLTVPSGHLPWFTPPP